MQWTNLFKLPLPVYEAVIGKLYQDKRDGQVKDYIIKHKLPLNTVCFSVSDLIKPPRMKQLLYRYDNQIIKDVSMEIFRILGTAVHDYLREYAVKKLGYTAEERIITHILIDNQTVILSGEPDLISPDGTLDDYKVVGVWAWQKGVKIEWEQQLNMYSWLRFISDKAVSGLRICFILRDWSVMDTVKEGYPKAGSQMMDVQQWTVDQQYQYIEGRIRLHLQSSLDSDDALNDCTPEEIWEKPESWAIIREGSKRATKVIRTPGIQGNEEATGIAGDKNEKLKKDDKPFFVEHRPGERTRCEKFCSVNSFCSQYKEYISVKFRG